MAKNKNKKSAKSAKSVKSVKFSLTEKGDAFPFTGLTGLYFPLPEFGPLRAAFEKAGYEVGIVDFK